MFEGQSCEKFFGAHRQIRDLVHRHRQCWTDSAGQKMAQQQDLSLFVDNSIVAQDILCLVTHTQGTSPSWLVDVLVENGLYGTCNINHDKQRRVLKGKVVLVSFLHNEAFYDLKRLGIELSGVKHFQFVDLFTDLFVKVSDGVSLSKVFTQIAQQIQEDTTLIVEGIEFLLSASQITSTQLLNVITKLQKVASSVFIVSTADKELIDVKVHNPMLPEVKTADFLLRLIHRANIVLSLRPLETGKANDVTGTLTISRGALPSVVEVLEKEYLFLVSKDQQVKLFFR